MSDQLTRNSVSHSVRWPTVLLASLLLAASTACSSSGEPAPAKQVELPPVSFLLPAPIALDAEAGSPDAHEESLRLFSAPVLDPIAIETLATRYEIRSRELLLERQAQLVELICGLPPGERQIALRQLEQERQQQWNRWVNLQERYEASLRYRLARSVHPDDAIGG
ncbi:MAG TPA: hypothetical protein VLA12_08945, partial [Planctomycetaceae bacterium]|nr:hypothetical protein [Planctomycetaceae bacterium]